MAQQIKLMLVMPNLECHFKSQASVYHTGQGHCGASAEDRLSVVPTGLSHHCTQLLHTPFQLFSFSSLPHRTDSVMDIPMYLYYSSYLHIKPEIHL